MKKIIISLAVSIMFLGLGVSAQVPEFLGVDGTISPADQEVRGGTIQNNATTPTIEVKQQESQPTEGETKALNSKTQLKFKLGLKEAREKMEQTREDFRVKVEASKQGQEAKRNKAKEELKAKLDAIKNAKKKEVVLRIDENMAKLNVKFIEKWTKVLFDFDNQITLIAEKVAVQTANGKNTDSVTKSIDSAKAAIVVVRAAVETQVNKIYTINVSTEEKLKADVSSVRDTLNNDLKSTKDLVQAAHTSMVNVVTEFNKLNSSLGIK